MYLALTGRSVGRADAYRLGLVTHCIPAARFAEIRGAVADADPVDPVLDDAPRGPGCRRASRRCGRDDRPLLRRRQRRGHRRRAGGRAGRRAGVGRGRAAGPCARCSPTSLKVTHRHVRQAGELDLGRHAGPGLPPRLPVHGRATTSTRACAPPSSIATRRPSGVPAAGGRERRRSSKPISRRSAAAELQLAIARRDAGGALTPPGVGTSPQRTAKPPQPWAQRRRRQSLGNRAGAAARQRPRTSDGSARLARSVGQRWHCARPGRCNNFRATPSLMALAGPRLAGQGAEMLRRLRRGWHGADGHQGGREA